MHKSLGDDTKKFLMLATLGLLFCLAFAFAINRNPVTLYRSDMYLRWYAIDKLFSDARDLYDSRNGEEVISYAWGEQTYPWTPNFYYPAHLLVLIGPLALLPYPVAHLIWTVTGQIFYLVGVWLSMRLVAWPDSVNKRTALIVAAAFFLPYIRHTIWGQFNTIGVLSLVLCLYALRKGHHGLAGVLAIGFTFKPHTTVLTLAFLILWALFKRERWPFLFGFGLSALVTWAAAEVFQPGWVLDFVKTLGAYGSMKSAFDLLWNPYQVVAGVSCAMALFLFLRNRRTPATSAAFAGCICLSLAVWCLVVPAIDIMHIVMLPVAVVLLLASLQVTYPRLYRCALIATALVYILGIVGFAWGLSRPELYGKHILWTEYAYNIAVPMLVGLFSLPLCSRGGRQVGILA
jgi:hypothetical protein